MRPTVAPKADRPPIGHKTWLAPSRCLPPTVAPLPACPRAAALRLALCPSLRVLSFSFVLQRAHLLAFHSHFLTAHNTQFHRSPLCSSVLTCLHSIGHFLAAHNTGSPFTFVLQCAYLLAFHSHFLTAHNTGSLFTFVLQRAHLPAFHSHFLTAHNTQFHLSPSCTSVLACLHSIAIFSLHTIQVHRSPSCSGVLTYLHSIAALVLGLNHASDF